MREKACEQEDGMNSKCAQIMMNMSRMDYHQWSIINDNPNKKSTHQREREGIAKQIGNARSRKTWARVLLVLMKSEITFAVETIDEVHIGCLLLQALLLLIPFWFKKSFSQLNKEGDVYSI
jgi:hypothetical protein